MQGSKHYSNEAVDLRTRDIQQYSLEEVCNDLRNILGPDYDVVLEKDHCHLEYDPS